ncbi:MAG: threonylcarbamoyl-AMP synthase [Chloroflexi bacterium]|nr:threonylcarbamoyl-AMP synthase [Chloroflexota bacterium]MCI0801706.1 threonylcarbamoyl-AMP synthase [Chloroflexota bacterium]MCI0829626.1 threonylcarbamoyl-AMP synthase [Chloroflexota bacterium]MCI0848180.1 threonylcarbamoyl-AMP synthase [Chloroflexota bacterium]MCI0864779.1 threonylcarbamoyl-AMP synthase [Chloroflexota bacterium]
MVDTQGDMEGIDLERAVAVLKNGGVVAIPTDTLYGLAADVFNPAALDRVFAVKGRPDDLALPVLVSGWEQVKRVAENFPPQAQNLAERFWPGGLTLVVQKIPGLPDRLTAGGPTVAVRMPGHPVPIQLIDGLGGPITGTSANISGDADIPSLAELTAQIGGRVDYIVKSGPVPEGKASTVIDITSGHPKLLREGAIPFERLLRTWEMASN